MKRVIEDKKLDIFDLGKDFGFFKNDISFEDVKAINFYNDFFEKNKRKDFFVTKDNKCRKVLQIIFPLENEEKYNFKYESYISKEETIVLFSKILKYKSLKKSNYDEIIFFMVLTKILEIPIELNKEQLEFIFSLAENLEEKMKIDKVSEKNKIKKIFKRK